MQVTKLIELCIKKKRTNSNFDPTQIWNKTPLRPVIGGNQPSTSLIPAWSVFEGHITVHSPARSRLLHGGGGDGGTESAARQSVLAAVEDMLWILRRTRLSGAAALLNTLNNNNGNGKSVGRPWECFCFGKCSENTYRKSSAGSVCRLSIRKSLGARKLFESFSRLIFLGRRGS